MREPPSGTITFLFTDIEGSTKRWQQSPAAMAPAVARHDVLLRTAIETHDGYVFKTVGDAFCAAFATAPDALAAALTAQHALIVEPWAAEVAPIRVRMALHSGAAEERDADYFGPTVNRVARLLSTGYGEQVLLSLATQELVRDVLRPGVTLRDMGRHRLKDLAEPEQIFQLLSPELHPDFPALKTLDHRPNNLPQQMTPFVGREREVAEARERLTRSDVRLLTLTGPGGTGKTRLSLQIAAELVEEFADGLFFITLDQVTDPALVMADVAQAIGVREAGGQPILETLQEFLRDKQLLLVLDNFEQVTGAAAQLAQLLLACPRVKALVTSRVRLRLHGEHEYAVPPLGLPPRTSLPPPEELLRYEAIRLFVERARAVKSDFELTADNASAVVGICHDLDGLPLAIELAAARVRLLPPQAMRQRLENRLALLTGGGQDRPERQQTLRGAIAWSHDLLSSEEQTLFARLAVFAGGCTLEAAEAVCNEAGDLGIDVLDGIESLTDKSLLRQTELKGEPRFSMLSTIREFGLEQLAAGGEEELFRLAHADYVLRLAEQAEPALTGPDQETWINRLEAEHDNLRAALGLLTSTGGEATQSLRLAGTLWRFWWARGFLSEGRTWLERALAQPGADAPAPRTKTLIGAGALAASQGDYERATELLQDALARARAVNERRTMAQALGYLGIISDTQGELGRAAELYEEALALQRALGDERGIAATLHELGSLAIAQDDLERAEVLAAESLKLFSRSGDRHGLGTGLDRLAELAFHRKDFARAATLYEESLDVWRALDDQIEIANGLSNVGLALQQQGELDRASSLYAEALTLYRELGEVGGIGYALLRLGQVAHRREEEARAEEFLREGLALFARTGELRRVAQSLENLAAVATARADPARAVRLFGAAEALRAMIGVQTPPSERDDYMRDVAAARAAFGEAGFAAAWAAGAALTPEQAVAEVIGANGG